MSGNHSPTLPKPVHLSVNGLYNTTLTSTKPLVNQIEKVHLYFYAPVK